jgi:hypothetical protein
MVLNPRRESADAMSGTDFQEMLYPNSDFLGKRSFFK